MATLFRVGRVRDRGQRAEKVGTRPSSGWSEPGACRDVSARPRDAGRAQPRTARAARGPDTRARRRRRLARQLAPGVTVLLLGTLPRRPRPQFDDPRPRLPSRHRGRYEPEHRTEGREDRSRRSRAGRAGLPPAHSPSCCPRRPRPPGGGTPSGRPQPTSRPAAGSSRPLRAGVRKRSAGRRSARPRAPMRTRLAVAAPTSKAATIPPRTRRSRRSPPRPRSAGRLRRAGHGGRPLTA